MFQGTLGAFLPTFSYRSALAGFGAGFVCFEEVLASFSGAFSSRTG
jgi:hypothetical protein